MAEAAEGLGVQHVFLHAMEVVNHRHAAPAHAKGRMHIGLRPVHHPAQFVPIGHLFKGQMFNRRAGDDQTIKLLTRRLDLGKGAVEGFHMLSGRVAGLMFAHADQMEVDLQGRSTNKPGELGLGLDLFRHQVKKPDPQRTNVLLRRPVRRHDHDAFVLQNVIGGQGGGERNGHLEKPDLLQ